MGLVSNEAVLLLEDGSVFKGKSVGATATTGGEICFNTGMTGYQEIYTDPSYFGQIIINTNPHIGNYGVNDLEQESSSPKFAGLVCKSFSSFYSREQNNGSLQQYFGKYGIVGIEGVDTRQLVRHIRSKGAMNAIISSEILDIEELKKKLKAVPSMEGLKLSDSVSTKAAYEIGSSSAKHKVAVLDMGIKQSILNNFVERDCLCKVFPAKTSYKEMKAWGAKGFFISNGPGDPSVETDAVAT
ncbi:MAG: carbamoyl phosphate synthase small subunit, partial [Cytophagales bacterium]|nr:carbamoyl phosphate synthase small subunit [Cytophagales bacterium]